MAVYRERYFIYFYLIIIFKLNACLYERKPRSAEVVNKEINTDNIHGLLIEGSKLIYCNTNTIQDNFCFHVKKFTIAKNQSFHCDQIQFRIIFVFTLKSLQLLKINLFIVMMEILELLSNFCHQIARMVRQLM